MSRKPRDYQESGIEATALAVSSKRKVIRQLPTGGGKTFEFALLVQRYIRSTEKSVLILVHRKELMYQAAKTIKSLTDFNPSLITSETKSYRVSQVYIGMVESTVKRLNLFDSVGLVIIDECHIANFNKVHSIFLEELIIGYSATPISSNKRMPMNKFYNDINCGPQIGELIERGFLAQNITRAPSDVVDATKFEIDKLKGEYNEKQMATEYKLPRFVINVAKNYWEFCNKQKTIVFNVTLEHSKLVAECLSGLNINARHLGSDNEHERDEILQWFKVTEDAVLCNVGITTVGFDEPTVQHIIINFATLSITKYLQCIGRGGRIIDEEFIRLFQKDYPYTLKPKKHFNVIDMGANNVRFGDWNEDRDWERIFNNPERVYDGVAPTKTCPKCSGLLHAAVRVCKLEGIDGEPCLHEFLSSRPVETSDKQNMVVVTKNINLTDQELDEILLGQKPVLSKNYNTMFDIGEDVVNEMYRRTSFPTEDTKQKYFNDYFDVCVKWYDRNMAGKNGNVDSIKDSGWHVIKAHKKFKELCDKKEKIQKPLPPVVDIDKEDVVYLMSDAARFYNSDKYKPTGDDLLYEW